MLQCYLDDSGTTDLPVIAIGGFVTTVAEWQRLEPIWENTLSSAGIAIFHAKEFHSTRPPFKGWSGIRKQSLVRELFSPAKKRIGGVSVTVRKSMVAASKDSGQFAQASPFGIAFALILNAVVQKAYQFEANPRVSFLVERGNKNNAEIEKYFRMIADKPAFGGSLNAIEFISKGHCRAIQIADMLAFYTRREARNYDRFQGKLVLPMCRTLSEIRQHIPIWSRHFSRQPVFPGIHVDEVENLDHLAALANRQMS